MHIFRSPAYQAVNMTGIENGQAQRQTRSHHWWNNWHRLRNGEAFPSGRSTSTGDRLG
ncbi:hypothetical protein VARIO8X_110121 [Burkholderiales bacterium 8X]|nr:hypothetical protein VARIO8X_110121 [Burkholderiales bacterium 8X]